MDSNTIITDLILQPEDGLDTEELTQVLSQEELTQVLSQELTQHSEELTQPSEELIRQSSIGLQSKIKGDIPNPNTKRIKKSEISKTYYILAHGQLALIKHDFNYYCEKLADIKHITTPNSILLTRVIRNRDSDSDSIIFPLLHNLCNEKEITWNGITEDFILSSSASTNDYDGVYLCIDKVAVRVIPFKNKDVKVRLSSVVSKICVYNQEKFPEQYFNVRVLSCLKEIGNEKNCSVSDFKGLPMIDCKRLDLSRDSFILIGGKTKKRKQRRTRKKRSRKKTIQSYHRRR